jgi:hypothetical protein
MKNPIKFIKIAAKLTFLIAAISIFNCAKSYYCQKADEKSNECDGYTGQKQSECYEELRDLQQKCTEESNKCDTLINNLPDNIKPKIPDIYKK